MHLSLSGFWNNKEVKSIHSQFTLINRCIERDYQVIVRGNFVVSVYSVEKVRKGDEISLIVEKGYYSRSNTCLCSVGFYCKGAISVEQSSRYRFYVGGRYICKLKGSGVVICASGPSKVVVYAQSCYQI